MRWCHELYFIFILGTFNIWHCQNVCYLIHNVLKILRCYPFFSILALGYILNYIIDSLLKTIQFCAYSLKVAVYVGPFNLYQSAIMLSVSCQGTLIAYQLLVLPTIDFRLVPLMINASDPKRILNALYLLHIVFELPRDQQILSALRTKDLVRILRL